MVRKNPLVSIIIPTYNRSSVVVQSIRSALQQSYKNIEVIVIDDASTDTTKKEIAKIKDSRLHYVLQKKNQGAPAARNKGITKAKGDFINFLDDDDLLLPRKIELQLEKFKKTTVSTVGVVTCDVRYVRSDLNGIRKNRKQGNIYLDTLKRYCVYGTESLLIKKEFLLPFDTRLESNQEYDLTIRLAKICSFDFVPLVLTEKFETQGQISFNFKKKISGTRMLWHIHVKEFKKHNVFLYNYCRFSYLLFKYAVGRYVGKKFYLLLP